jgi:hypothetical protein
VRKDLATLQVWSICNLYSITTNQTAIIGLFCVLNRYVGNLPLIMELEYDQHFGVSFRVYLSC